MEKNVYLLISLNFSIPRCVLCSEDFVNFIKFHGFVDKSSRHGFKFV